MAIISVVCAHTSAISDYYDGSILATISWGMNGFGAFGVPTFFLISGYFFGCDSSDFSTFLRKKVVHIIVPWAFCYSMLWLFVTIRKNEWGVGNYFKFLFGITSSSYYLTMLLVLYLILWKFRRKIWIVVALVAISITWFLIGDIFPFATISIVPKDKYFNILYWVIYFALGLLVSYYNNLDKLLEVMGRILPISFIGVLVMFAGKRLCNKEITYFSRFAFLEALLMFIFFAGIASTMSKYNWSFLERIGKYSFSIYLLHQFFAGFIVRITSIHESPFLLTLRPFINIAFVLIVIKMLEVLEERVGRKLLFVRVAIGIRG